MAGENQNNPTELQQPQQAPEAVAPAPGAQIEHIGEKSEPAEDVVARLSAEMGAQGSAATDKALQFALKQSSGIKADGIQNVG